MVFFEVHKWHCWGILELFTRNEAIETIKCNHELDSELSVSHFDEGYKKKLILISIGT